MSRRHAAPKREILPDAKFGDLIVSKFINVIMLQGKKSLAEQIVYGAFEAVEKKLSRSALEVFNEVLENVKPQLEVRSRRVGGATYQVPMEVRSDRAQAVAFRWIIAAARGRNEHTMTERLAAEILEAFNGRGVAVKKRDDTHRMAEANRAFAHYRW